MNFYGLLRVKNEARWIERSLRSIQSLCRAIFVFDDNSTDATPELCRQLGATVIESPFTDLNESRDKDYLLSSVYESCGPFAKKRDWAIAIDGDEVLEAGSAKHIRAVARLDMPRAWSFQILYLWNDEGTLRTDGVYKCFRRGSMFPLGREREPFIPQTDHGGNFHCASVPEVYRRDTPPCAARLLHYGYIDRAMRVRKWDFYNTHDPHNGDEDHYRHMIQGDVPYRDCPACRAQGHFHPIMIPLGERLRHAGPLRLEPYAPNDPRTPSDCRPSPADVLRAALADNR